MKVGWLIENIIRGAREPRPRYTTYGELIAKPDAMHNWEVAKKPPIDNPVYK
jgi:hypothetical protein